MKLALIYTSDNQIFVTTEEDAQKCALGLKFEDFGIENIEIVPLGTSISVGFASKSNKYDEIQELDLDFLD